MLCFVSDKMSDDPDDSNTIHEQPTDTCLNETSSASSSSSSDEDEVPENESRPKTDSQILERINVIGQRYGPIRPPRRSYCPSISSTTGTSRRVSSESETGDSRSGRSENSNSISLGVLER